MSVNGKAPCCETMQPIEEPIMWTQLSDDLAGAIAAITPHLLASRGRRGHSTLIAVDAHHAIGSAHNLRRLGQVTYQGHEVAAALVGRHPGLDLALVRVDTELQPVRWAELPQVGHLVLPVGVGPRASLGFVGRVAGPWHTPQGAEVSAWIEVDGHLPPGLSGGPLLASDGAVIGMNTRRLVRGGTTLPAATLQTAVEALQQRGSVDPGFLGIGGATATLTDSQATTAGQDEALLVVAVEPGSPADGVLAAGDIVLAIADTEVRGIASLRAVLDAHAPGSQLALSVLDGDTVVQREVTLGARPARCR
jgi:S1-C subfamily serine protease